MPLTLPLVQKSQIIFIAHNQEAKLKKPVASLVQASYSTVLTLADHILQYHPDLHPPKFNETVSFHPQSEAPQHSKQFLNYNKLFQPWCDYLSELVLDNKVSQKDDICILWDQVSQSFIKKLNLEMFEVKETKTNEHTISQSESQADFYKESANKSKMQHQKGKKIGIVNFALSQLRTDFIKPKMHLIGLFTGIFYNQGDQWKTFNVLKRQYPSVQEYKELDTLILSGSALSVNDENPQVVGFVQTLKQAITYNPKLKILGICFGHQTLAKMFGGKIVAKRQIAGVQRIDFDSNLIKQTPYFRRTEIDEKTFELSEYHKDFVVEVPKDFEIFAQSQTCKIESLISKNKKYLSFQFHPQYSAEYIKGFEMRLQHYQLYDLKSSYSYTQRSSISHNESLWQIRRIIRNFIDWKVEENF